MNEDWKIEPLNIVCSEIIDCVNKTAPVVDYKTDYKMIRTTNVKKGKVDTETVRYVTKETFQKWTRRVKPKKGDIILTREAPLGEVGILRSDDNIFLGQRLIQYRANPEIMDQHFLYYAFQDVFMQGQITSFGSGATVEHLRIGDCETIKVKFPPLPLQAKIASILSAYDDLIENNNQRIKLLEEMAEEIYKEWFVRMRFPGYESSKFYNEAGEEVPLGTVGALPEGWSYSKLRDCIDHYIGGGWGEEKPNGKNIEPAYVIRGTDISNTIKGNLNFDVLRYHSESNLENRRLKIHDIIFEVSGGTESQSLGRTAFISKLLIDRYDHDIICASFCKLIRPNLSKIASSYLYQFLTWIYKTGEIMLYQVQSTGISNYKFEDFISFQKIIIPSKDIQSKYCQIAEPMFDEIQVLGSKNQLLQQTRDLLLPRLMSGKLSVAHLIKEEEVIPIAAEPQTEYEVK